LAFGFCVLAAFIDFGATNREQSAAAIPRRHFSAIPFFVLFYSPRINGIQRMIFVCLQHVPSCPPAAIAPHLTIEQQQKTKKAIQGGAGF
jgi:hypothetical protein